jgi:hypothetical protein
MATATALMAMQMGAVMAMRTGAARRAWGPSSE